MTDYQKTFLELARIAFHSKLKSTILKINNNGVPSNSDKDSKTSVAMANGMLKEIGQCASGSRLKGQISGMKFEEICSSFVNTTFNYLRPCRPGKWIISKGVPGDKSTISAFEQYEHLAQLDHIAKNNRELAAALGRDYLIKPDVVICREPEDDDFFNRVFGF